MDSRRTRINLLEYIYMALLGHTYITGIDTTACTDQTGMDNFNHAPPTGTATEVVEKYPRTALFLVVAFYLTVSVISMCNNGTLISPRVVIDTWGTGGDGTYSCTCTVTLATESTTSTTLVVEEYPRVAPLQNCGSILTISSTKSSSHTKTGCSRIPSTATTDFGTSDKLTLTLSRADVSTWWTSGHYFSNLIVTCSEAQGQSTTTTTTTTNTTTEYVPTTTIPPLTTTTTTELLEKTTTLGETTTSTTSREVTTYNVTTTGQTTSGQEKCVQISHPQQGYPLSAVVAPLVVTMIIMVVFTTANLILYRRRLALVKQPEYTEAVMTSPNPAHYDSLDLSRVEPPNLYADTSAGQTYVNTAMES